MNSSIVKQCPMCARRFSAADLLQDLSVEVIGMMTLVEPGGNASYFFFNHNCPGCGTSFVISTEHFAEFITEQAPAELLAGGPVCQGHCTQLDDLTVCDAVCANAPLRRFLVNVLLNGPARHEIVRLRTKQR